MSPWWNAKEQIDVPCGRCVNCKARRVSGWSFRLMKEAERSCSAFFVTLTYDTEYVPITKNGFMSVEKDDVQKFFKRLRKNHGKSNIKYYVAAEYSPEKMRPHYHIILFNACEKHVDPSWGLGSVHIGQVTVASVGYTLKYINKETRIPIHARDDRQKEFSLMSKKMGANYLTPAMRAWHDEDMLHRVYCNLTDGKKIAMPRYYKLKLYTKADMEQIGTSFVPLTDLERSVEREVNIRKSRSKKDQRSLKL